MRPAAETPVRGASEEDAQPARSGTRVWKRRRLYRLSRFATCAVVAASLGGLFLEPAGPWQYTADILVRSYLAFLGTVMAHEAVHGLMGRTPRSNLWWGRLALVPCMVPFTNFRKTHLLHHRHTNEAGRDPDHFITPRQGREWEIPIRAVAMPHHWLLWLRRRRSIDTAHVRELLLNYAGIALIYLPILAVVGPQRLAFGMIPLLVIVSLLLWYPFAFKTHEGFSTGDAASRSHNYYGRLMYWFSFGLSMHRTHHMRPYLGWIELLQFVEAAPSMAGRLIPMRDIQIDEALPIPDAQPRSHHA